MPRPRKVDRPTRIEVNLPESLHAKLKLELWSELEGGVPKGAYTNLFSQLVREWLEARGVAV